jgi:hypothetical protein
MIRTYSGLIYGTLSNNSFPVKISNSLSGTCYCKNRTFNVYVYIVKM